MHGHAGEKQTLSKILSWQTTRRRLLLSTGTALVSLGSPCVTGPAHAQRTPASARVGVLSTRPIAGNALLAAFRQSLAEGGFIEGRTVAFEYRSSDGRGDGLPPLAAELVRLDPSLIFAASSAAAVAAKTATSTIPIVFAGASDPVRLGLVASLGKPGGNLTGATRYSHALGGKRLQLLKDLVPDAVGFAVLVNPANPNAADEIADVKTAAATLGMALTVVEARDAGETERAMAGIGQRNLRALYVLDDPFFTGRIADLVAGLAIRYRVAAVSTSLDFAKAGALASYGADFIDVYRQCGVYAGRILKGASPADLPVMLPTRFTLTINLRTARALGLAIAPAILASAGDVIE